MCWLKLPHTLRRLQRAHVPARGAFFLRNPAPTEIYTLSLHDALPISRRRRGPHQRRDRGDADGRGKDPGRGAGDRKSTRLNSSHANISYAVFCLKKKKKKAPIKYLMSSH